MPKTRIEPDSVVSAQRRVSKRTIFLLGSIIIGMCALAIVGVCAALLVDFPPECRPPVAVGGFKICGC
jgi:hypothetical protein